MNVWKPFNTPGEGDIVQAGANLMVSRVGRFLSFPNLSSIIAQRLPNAAFGF
jgi:hypothetical protein